MSGRVVNLGALPRLMVAGLAGDTGKSLVAFGLTRALVKRGLRVAPFKKGPDFIDAAWIGAAAGRPGRNLDTYLMPTAAIGGSVYAASAWAEVAVIEGNRGLFDGMDALGSHSSAELAKLIQAPVILVVNATKVTRTMAALVLGCQTMDAELDIAGVVLNRVATERHTATARQAIESTTGLPVLGALPRLDIELPGRHLGLLPAAEHDRAEQVLDAAAAAVERYLDVDAMLSRASACVPPAAVVVEPEATQTSAHVRIGVLRDRAFSFYYPENLEALQRAGAQLVEISPIVDQELPAIDALYAGGGFPEVYAEELTANTSLREALRQRIDQGLPVYAECGGLMYLAKELVRDGVSHPMVGALPVVVEQMRRPQGHGYVSAQVDGDNPFYARGTRLLGHEFHYSRLSDPDDVPTSLALERGQGVGQGRDGLCLGSVMASYTHVHALGAPQWATGLVRAAGGAA